MEYPLEFITWLENHDDLCKEQFQSSIIAEYLKGYVEWYPVILYDMDNEGTDEEKEPGYWHREFDRRVSLLYEMFVSGEIKHKHKKINLYGYLNKTGDFVIEPKFDNALNFYKGRAWVSTNNKYGSINKKGEYLIEPLYDEIGSSTEDATWVKFNGLWGLLDNDGKFIIEPLYDFDYMKSYSEGLTAVTTYEKIGFVDTKGNILIKPSFNVVEGKWGYIDKNSQQVIEPIFEEVYDFKDEFACVKINGMYGFINTTGDYVIEPKYKNATYCGNGVVMVNIKNKVRLINMDGEIVGAPLYKYMFDIVFDFNEGVAVAFVDGEFKCINLQGEYVIEPRYDIFIVSGFSDGLMCVMVRL